MTETHKKCFEEIDSIKKKANEILLFMDFLALGFRQNKVSADLEPINDLKALQELNKTLDQCFNKKKD